VIGRKHQLRCQESKNILGKFEKKFLAKIRDLTKDEDKKYYQIFS
jgi:hypothetical protein